MYEKNGIAILVPHEYDIIRSALRKKHKVLADFLLYTGVRYTEARQVTIKLYDRNKKYIYLPHGLDKKKKRTAPDRYVHLSTLGRNAIDRYFEEPYTFPTYVDFDQVLRTAKRRTGIIKEDVVLSIKTFRKTWECWLAITYPERIVFIVMSQGHSEMVAIKHYLNLPFSPEEKREIQEQVSGWMTE